MNRSSGILCGVALALLVGGCITHPEPIVDLEGVDPEVYEVDRQQCAAYANETSLTEGTAKGAAIGTATGAITDDVAQGAGYDSIETPAGVDAEREKQLVFARCLRDRGYRVLN
jgi:hypothetical protein